MSQLHGCYRDKARGLRRGDTGRGTLGTPAAAAAPWQHLHPGDPKALNLRRHVDERVKPGWTAGEERDANPAALAAANYLLIQLVS